MKPLRTTPDLDYRRTGVFASCISPQGRLAPSVDSHAIDSRSFYGVTGLQKNPSQTSLMDSVSQVGFNVREQNTLEALRVLKNELSTKKLSVPGKENVSDRKQSIDIPSKIMSQGLIDNLKGSTILSSVGICHRKKQSYQGTDVSVSKSKPKDRKIQELIQSNIPKMTKDKEFYATKLIQCENALRIKEKKVKLLEKTESQLQKTLLQVSASQLMYKTQLQAFQKTQKSKIEQMENLQSKISELCNEHSQKQAVWKSERSGLIFQISNLKEKAEFQNASKASIESQIKQNNKLQQFKNMYFQVKLSNTQLQAKNSELLKKIQSFEKESILKDKKIENINSGASATILELQGRVAALQKQNQQLTINQEHLIVCKEKQIQSSLMAQKLLKIQVETLTQSLNAKVSDGQSSTSQLKASHDHLKFQNSKLKKFVQENQSQQVQLQGILKLRNLQLQSQLKQIKNCTVSEKQALSNIIQSLKSELDQYKNRIPELQKQIQKKTFQWQNSKMLYVSQISHQQQKLKQSQNKIKQIDLLQEKFDSLTIFTQVQSKQIQNMLRQSVKYEEKSAELNNLNAQLLEKVQKAEPLVQTFIKLVEQLQKYQSKLSEGIIPDQNQVYSTINSAITKQLTFWNSFIKTKDNPYQAFCIAILKTLEVEEVEGWEDIATNSFTNLVQVQKQFKQLTAKFKERVKYFETRLHVCKEEDQRKTLVISELKSNIKLTEKSLNEVSDKLLKCTTLLEQANQKIIVGEARLLDAKNELNTMYSQMKSQNQKIREQGRNVEVQLRDLLSKHYQGFYDQIVQRSPEDLLRLDVFLFKAFLSTCIEVTHHIKQVQATSAYMQELLVERDGILGEIRQYYKQLLEPEIAQYLVHYKPLNQNKAPRFQGY